MAALVAAATLALVSVLTRRSASLSATTKEQK
jgi:hypothetical protein